MNKVKPEANLAIMGMPGAGKSTQSQLVSSTFGLMYASAANALGDEIFRGTELGEVISDHLVHGARVPIDLVAQAMFRTLEKAASFPGFVLDGFPRTAQAALSLAEFLRQQGWELSAFILLELPKDMAITRLTSRGICPECGAVHLMYDTITRQRISVQSCPICGHEIVRTPAGALQERTNAGLEGELAQTTSAMAQTRIQLYQDNIEPVLEYYRGQGISRSVDATGSPRDTFELIVKQAPVLNRLPRLE